MSAPSIIADEIRAADEALEALDAQQLEDAAAASSSSSSADEPPYSFDTKEEKFDPHQRWTCFETMFSDIKRFGKRQGFNVMHHVTRRARLSTSGPPQPTVTVPSCIPPCISTCIPCA